MTRAILGIDPGLSGALALWNGTTLSVFDVPTIARKVNGKTKQQVDAYQLGNWLDIHRVSIRFAIIEQVNAMPAQGVTSSFNFGYTAGVIQGAVAANQIPMRLVVPSVWKRAFGLIGQDKDASRAAASRLAPKHAEHWPLKKHDGRAEAFLLAFYGAMIENSATL